MSATTKATRFGGSEDRLFAVNPGVSRREAILHATCAVNSVKQRLDAGLENGGVDDNEAWILYQALDATQAILEACE